MPVTRVVREPSRGGAAGATAAAAFCCLEEGDLEALEAGLEEYDLGCVTGSGICFASALPNRMICYAGGAGGARARFSSAGETQAWAR